MTTARSTILIAGPTASGKSALALALALARDGSIINADSMQVYRELRVLTARPSQADEEQAPHALYGHVAGADGYSVAGWLADVALVLEATRSQGRTPIIVGGTGLYFEALLRGLSPVPPIPEAVRRRWREAALAAAPGDMHRQLAAVDPVMAARLDPADRQRLTRALEVMEATGRSLAEWQSTPGTPLVDEAEAECIVVRPERAVLHGRSDRRFDQMMDAGAVDEVRALVQLGLPTDRPVMRALGVAPIAAYLAGVLSRVEAAERGKLETRQYIKRQETWLRRRMRGWRVLQSGEAFETRNQQ